VETDFRNSITISTGGLGIDSAIVVSGNKVSKRNLNCRAIYHKICAFYGTEETI
jgi:hypothetical protein